MGLLSLIFGKKEKKPAEEKPKSVVVPEPKATVKQESRKEERPVSNKITLGHVHMSGCTGCCVSIADTFQGLFTLLDNYADLVYSLTLADVRHIPKMDVALVEGSVCLQDELSIEEIKETREKATVVVALGGCAAYGNITRFSRGGQWNQPQHESFVPINELIDVDVFIPGCAPCPEVIRNVAVMAYLLLKGNDAQKKLATAYLSPLMALAKKGCGSCACGCDIMTDVINQGLCIGCGTCAASCPVYAISMEDGKPNVDREMCIKCGACYSSCPRSFFSFDVCGDYENILGAITAAMNPGGN
jgi:coenzyme F420 hydrogenase subunit gamma